MNSTARTVVVIYGGPGVEHEVSCMSARHVLDAIDKDKYQVCEVFVDKNLQYHSNGSTYSEQQGITYIKVLPHVLVWPLIHGTYGEDGTLQELLERESVSYIGSSSLVSRVAIDKDETGKVYQAHGLNVPRSIVVTVEDVIPEDMYPIIIKPVHEGSSVGLYKCMTSSIYERCKDGIFSKYAHMLVQEFIQGREFTCGVIDVGGVATALTPTEVVLTLGETFDYQAKYTPGGCKEITPPHIDSTLFKEIQTTALRCHQVLGCRSISRTDMMERAGVLYVLETNTMPGMTETSFIPAQAVASGYTMHELCEILIDGAS